MKKDRKHFYSFIRELSRLQVFLRKKVLHIKCRSKFMTHVPRHCANLNAPCIKKGKIIICKAHVFFPFSKPASPYCLFSPFLEVWIAWRWIRNFHENAKWLWTFETIYLIAFLGTVTHSQPRFLFWWDYRKLTYSFSNRHYPSIVLTEMRSMVKTNPWAVFSSYLTKNIKYRGNEIFYRWGQNTTPLIVSIS